MANFFDTLPLELKHHIHTFLHAWEEKWEVVKSKESSRAVDNGPRPARPEERGKSARRLRLVNKRNARDFVAMLVVNRDEDEKLAVPVMLNEFGLKEVEWLGRSALAPLVKRLNLADVYVMRDIVMLAEDVGGMRTGPGRFSKEWAKALRDQVHGPLVSKAHAEAHYEKEINRRVLGVRRDEDATNEALQAEVLDEELLDKFAEALDCFTGVESIDLATYTKTLAVLRCCKDADPADRGGVEEALRPVYSCWDVRDSEFDTSAISNSYSPQTCTIAALGKICARMNGKSAFGVGVTELRLTTSDIHHSLPTQAEVQDMVQVFRNVRVFELDERKSCPETNKTPNGGLGQNADEVLFMHMLANALSVHPWASLEELGLGSVDAADVLTIMWHHRATLERISAWDQQNYSHGVDIPIKQLECLLEHMPRAKANSYDDIYLAFDGFHQIKGEDCRLRIPAYGLDGVQDQSQVAKGALEYFYAVRDGGDAEAKLANFVNEFGESRESCEDAFPRLRVNDPEWASEEDEGDDDSDDEGDGGSEDEGDYDSEFEDDDNGEDGFSEYPSGIH